MSAPKFLCGASFAAFARVLSSRGTSPMVLRSTPLSVVLFEEPPRP